MLEQSSVRGWKAKKTKRSADRFVQDTRVSPRAPPENSASSFNRLLYSSLIEKVHPDTSYLSETPIKSIQPRPGTSQSLDFLRRCRRPFKVIQIDEVPSDFYVHPVDWSSRNMIAFARTKGVVMISKSDCSLFELILIIFYP